MKLKDNRQETKAREQGTISKARNRIVGKSREQLEKEKNEVTAKTITFSEDWRISGELLPITRQIWGADTKRAQEIFIRDAFMHRDKLNELIVEPFEPNHHSIQDPFVIEVGKEMRSEMSKEARKLGLTIVEYAQSIVYTAAKAKNDLRKKEEERKEYERERNAPVWFEGDMSKDLYDKLVEAFGPPQFEVNGRTYLFGVNKTLGEYLVKIANEHFGIK